MRKLKVMTIVGTRPEIIRLSRVIDQAGSHCDHVLVHTGQNYDYELNEVFFSDLDIRRPDMFLEAAGATAAETIGQVIMATDRLSRRINLRLLVLLGDTNSSLASHSGQAEKDSDLPYGGGQPLFRLPGAGRDQPTHCRSRLPTST